jgi:hypothetical protein
MGFLGPYLLVVAGLAALLAAVTVLVSLRPVVFRIEQGGTRDEDLMSRVADLWQPRVLRIGKRWAMPFNLASLPLRCLVYRPPENSVGVIYLFDRLWYVAGPNETVLRIPLLHRVEHLIGLKTRRADVFLSNRLTRDGVPMEINCIVYFRVDVRWAKSDFRLQALGYNEEIWRQITGTSLTSVANEVIAGLTMGEILASDGKLRLKRALSVLLARRARELGLVTNPRYGVMVESIVPARRIWEAMVEQMAAPSLGGAAHGIVEPMLELVKHHPHIGGELLQMGWTAAITRGQAPPGVLVSSRKDPERAERSSTVRNPAAQGAADGASERTGGQDGPDRRAR